MYIRKENLNTFVIFFTGVLTMLHQLTIFPYSIYAVCIVLVLVVWLFSNTENYRMKIFRASCSFLLWYGLFVLFIYISLIYSVNDINPDYVLKRVTITLVLGFFVSSTVKNKKDFITLTNGLISGAVLIVFFTIQNEGFKIGGGRIGTNTLGSAVALAGILMVMCMCSLWRLVYIKEKKWVYLIAFILSYTFILLSGTRRASIIVPVFYLALIFFNENIKKWKKYLLLSISIIVVFIGLYLILNDEDLYNIIGWRIESMINTLAGKNNMLIDASMQERSIMKNYAFALFKNKPLLGYGVHGFAYMFKSYYGRLLYSHCGIAEILSCYGIIGASIFYASIINLLRKLFFYLKSKRSEVIFLTLYVLMTLLTEMTTISFITPHVIILITSGFCIVNFETNKSDVDRGEVLE